MGIYGYSLFYFESFSSVFHRYGYLWVFYQIVIAHNQQLVIHYKIPNFVRFIKKHLHIFSSKHVQIQKLLGGIILPHRYLLHTPVHHGRLYPAPLSEYCS